MQSVSVLPIDIQIKGGSLMSDVNGPIKAQNQNVEPSQAEPGEPYENIHVPPPVPQDDTPG
jgi:hypothetical protein